MQEGLRSLFMKVFFCVEVLRQIAVQTVFFSHIMHEIKSPSHDQTINNVGLSRNATYLTIWIQFVCSPLCKTSS